MTYKVMTSRPATTQFPDILIYVSAGYSVFWFMLAESNDFVKQIVYLISLYEIKLILNSYRSTHQFDLQINSVAYHHINIIEKH
jgi:hypothetical protein